MADGSGQKRLCPDNSGKKGGWISHIVKKEKLTFAEVEQIGCRAFGFRVFPEWTHIEGTSLYMIKGNSDGSTERITMSFWPSTGTVLFQGTPEEKERDKRKWQMAMESYRAVPFSSASPFGPGGPGQSVKKDD